MLIVGDLFDSSRISEAKIPPRIKNTVSETKKRLP
jgi:hypothetical protein